MWQIRLHDSENFWNDNYEKMPLLKEVEEEPNTDSILEINDKTYHWCAINHVNKIIGVKEIELVDEENIEEHSEDDFTCPYCLHVNHDAFEFSDNGTEECGNCGSTIEFEREYTVSYRVIPVKKNNIVKL